MVDYKKYIVWEKSHKLTLKLYAVTHAFPTHEQFNLTSQIRRAAYSIPSNIAEGAGRQTQKEFIRFLYISSGSAFELEYLMLLAKNLKYIENHEALDISSQIDQIKKMLYALINRIKESL